MPIINAKITLETKGFTDIVDITQDVIKVIENNNIETAQALIYSQGSTVSITSIEYEPGLIKDLPEILDKIAPMDHQYHHDEKWQDGNGYAHIRASIIGNGINIPIINGSLALGTWQQIVLIDFDNRPRVRQVIVQILY
jgi:secondary thiamine-phosphate synthase enzyme